MSSRTGCQKQNGTLDKAFNLTAEREREREREIEIEGFKQFELWQLNYSTHTKRDGRSEYVKSSRRFQHEKNPTLRKTDQESSIKIYY